MKNKLLDNSDFCVHILDIKISRDIFLVALLIRLPTYYITINIARFEQHSLASNCCLFRFYLSCIVKMATGSTRERESEKTRARVHCVNARRSEQSQQRTLWWMMALVRVGASVLVNSTPHGPVSFLVSVECVVCVVRSAHFLHRIIHTHAHITNSSVFVCVLCPKRM